MWRRELVVGPAIQRSTSQVFSDTSPLLKEKRNSLFSALAPDPKHPFLLHRSSVGATFPSDDYPIDAFQVECSNVLEKRLDREEPHGDRRITESRDSLKSVLAVLHAHAKPNVRQATDPTQFAMQQITHALVPFC